MVITSWTEIAEYAICNDGDGIPRGFSQRWPRNVKINFNSTLLEKDWDTRFGKYIQTTGLIGFRNCTFIQPVDLKEDHSHFVHRHVLLSSNGGGSEVGSGGNRGGGGGGGEMMAHVQNDTSSKELEHKNVHEGHWSDPHWHEQVGSIEHSHVDAHKGRIKVDDASFTGNLVLDGEGNTFFQAFSNGFRLYVRHPVFLGK